MKRTPKEMDALVRQRLGQLPEPRPSAPGWDRLEAALEQDVDLHLRQRLTGLAPAADPAGWERLERELDPYATADAHLAAALTSLEPTPTAASWHRLAQRLDEATGEAVDAVVVDRLAATGEPTVSGWAALAARLELIGQRRGMIAAGKISEISLLLSLLLLLVRFGPAFPAPAPAPAPAVNRVAEALTPAPAAPAATATVSGPTATATRPTDHAPAARLSRPAPNRAVLPLAPTAPTAVTRRAAAASLPDVTAPVPVPAASDLLPARSGGVERDIAVPRPALRLPRPERGIPIRYHLNFFVSPFDVNQVITPATSIGSIDIDGDDRITQGSSAGILIDVTQANNTLQVGLIYSKRSYIPTALKWYLQEEYAAVEPLKGYSRFIHQAITVPFHYSRAVLTTDKWRFSANLGASINVIAKSDFYIPPGGQEELVETLNGRLDRFDLPDPNGPGNGRSRNVSQSRSLVEPPAGWLEGGSMLDNANFYLGGGLVAERLLSPRWSVYVSPSFGRVVYMNAAAGIGPYNDRIHLGNLRFGSRYLLSNK